jgi:2-oxo-4-hydroxy-4-carboxy--5-ureidoimidazoline (OHCU) decarboxylase
MEDQHHTAAKYIRRIGLENKEILVESRAKFLYDLKKIFQKERWFVPTRMELTKFLNGEALNEALKNKLDRVKLRKFDCT